MSNLDKIINSTIPILFGVLLIAHAFRFYFQYKRNKKRKEQEKLDKIPCLCGHERWIHFVRMHSTRTSCHDFDWDNMSCRCSAYRMNNLIYLEMKYEETR